MLNSDFLDEFKRTTEAKWSTVSLDPMIYGFQFQPGTRWNRGLSDEVVAEYENGLGVRFPHDFKLFLKAPSGPDIPTLNLYSPDGTPPCQRAAVHASPRCIVLLKRR